MKMFGAWTGRQDGLLAVIRSDKSPAFLRPDVVRQNRLAAMQGLIIR